LGIKRLWFYPRRGDRPVAPTSTPSIVRIFGSDWQKLLGASCGFALAASLTKIPHRVRDDKALTLSFRAASEESFLIRQTVRTNNPPTFLRQIWHRLCFDTSLGQTV